MKGYACQFQAPPRECMAPCQKLQKNQCDGVPQDVLVTKCITYSIEKDYQKIRVGVTGQKRLRNPGQEGQDLNKAVTLKKNNNILIVYIEYYDNCTIE